MAIPKIFLKRGYDYLQRKFREKVTLYSLTGESTNTHEQKTSTYTSASHKAVVYSTSDDITQQPFSELRSGEYIFLFKSSVTINRHDIVLYNSLYYEVTKVEPLPTNGGSVGNVATAILGKAPDGV